MDDLKFILVGMDGMFGDFLSHLYGLNHTNLI